MRPRFTTSTPGRSSFFLDSADVAFETRLESLELRPVSVEADAEKSDAKLTFHLEYFEKNVFWRSSRGDEAQILLEMFICLEPSHVGCYLLNGFSPKSKLCWRIALCRRCG